LIPKILFTKRSSFSFNFGCYLFIVVIVVEDNVGVFILLLPLELLVQALYAFKVAFHLKLTMAEVKHAVH